MPRWILFQGRTQGGGGTVNRCVLSMYSSLSYRPQRIFVTRAASANPNKSCMLPWILFSLV